VSRAARPQGRVTRGTTNPNRLRRVDNWITAACADLVRSAVDPVVVDLGYGGTPVTTLELRARLARLRPDVRVVGVEIDPARVAAADPVADPPGLTFVRGGFELAGLRPVLVRALNVLRQYDEAEVPAA
jgi:tRNA G46 methylase TrmB